MCIVYSYRICCLSSLFRITSTRHRPILLQCCSVFQICFKFVSNSTNFSGDAFSFQFRNLRRPSIVLSWTRQTTRIVVLKTSTVIDGSIAGPASPVDVALVVVVVVVVVIVVVAVAAAVVVAVVAVVVAAVVVVVVEAVIVVAGVTVVVSVAVVVVGVVVAFVAVVVAVAVVVVAV